MKSLSILPNRVLLKFSTVSTIFVVFVILFLIFLRNYIPINVLSLPFDDELFIRRAEVILSGEIYQFISGYNPLVKGVAYPWLLVLTNFLHINPLVFILVMTSIAFCAIAYISLGKKNIIYVNVVVLIALSDPSLLKSPASRIARESFYGLCLLLILIGIIMLIKILQNKNAKYFQIFLVAIFTGLILFIAQNIREERIWIYLNVILFIVSATAIIIKDKKDNLKKLIFFIFILFVSFTLFTNILKIFHNNIYNVYLTSTTIEGEFPKLLTNLASIDTGDPERSYVSITGSKRFAAYEVSPQFTKLKNYLEGPGGMWVQFGCANSNVCDDYANSYFHVALREAIKTQGYWQDQKQAQDFLLSINLEIETACQEKTINCVRALPLARGLGVTKISGSQILEVGNYISMFIKVSINNWDSSLSLRDWDGKFKEGSYYSPISDNSWEIWQTVINSLPPKQENFAQEYNFKTAKTTSYLQLWNFLHSIIIKVGLVFLIILNFLWVLKKIRLNIIKDIIVLSNLLLIIWLTRGVLLSFNSVTNLISINEYYSLPGRIFLSLAIAFSITAGLATLRHFALQKRL